MCDPAIKLFGKTIALPSHTDQAGAGRGGGGGVKGCTNNEEINTESKPNSEDKCDEPITSSITTTSSTADRETQLQKPPPSAAAAAAAAAAADDDHHHHHHQEEEKDPKTDQEEEEEQQQDEKPALKKPDKILPCPRCNSMDTKFCYYNNYNVNQPRHFCKNCQRYWTAGGTMRNVPVGAGRRKNKNAVAAAAAAHYRHLMTMTDAGPALKPKGTVLSFGSDMPLSESMASVLDLAEKSMKKKTCNRSSGFQRMQEHVEEQSTGSSATNSNSAADDEGNNGANLPEPAGFRNCQGLPPHLLYIGSSSPWPYPWNPPPPTPPTSAPFCGSTFPIPIYPAAAYWGGCSAWSIPWLAPLQGSPSPTTTPPGCGPPNSPTTTTMLGKHTREGNVLHRGSSADTSVANEQSSQEKCLWIPKTLRIDDPEEAAKSSIWATMGFSKKNDKADGFSSLGGGLFRSFQTKTELWSRRVDASQALHANPAALSRSIEFQESS